MNPCDLKINQGVRLAILRFSINQERETDCFGLRENRKIASLTPLVFAFVSQTKSYLAFGLALPLGLGLGFGVFLVLHVMTAHSDQRHQYEQTQNCFIVSSSLIIQRRLGYHLRRSYSSVRVVFSVTLGAGSPRFEACGSRRS